MPVVETSHFGPLEFQESDLLQFPAGLPAFEDQRRFLLVEREELAPVTFLQSADRPDLVFVTVPVLGIEPDYRLNASPDDLGLIGLERDRQPDPVSDVVCLAIVTIADGTATANLMAPILISSRSRCAVQAIQPDCGYSHQHPLPGAGNEEESCS